MHYWIVGLNVLIRQVIITNMEHKFIVIQWKEVNKRSNGYQDQIQELASRTGIKRYMK